jgi:prepilin-type N-terminal cleavage/methylation domain-containing protein
MMGGKFDVRSEKEKGGCATLHGCAPSTSSFLLPTSSFSRGVTLIELLVTMAIIAIISTAILGTARGAMENARRSRTRATIAKIHGLIMDHWDTYANRRVDVNPTIVQAIDQWAFAPNLDNQQRSMRNAWRGQMMADARLLALRELMKMEMPDRWSDVINQGLPTGGLQQPNDPDILAATPALARTYFRFLRTAEDNTDEDTVIQNQQAECLYLTVIYATGDGEARTMFPNQDIGDTDDDGAPEFLDGWGRPIRWRRWAPGFGLSDPSDTFEAQRRPTGYRANSLMTGDGDKDHDPFDILHRDSPSVTESVTPPNLPAPRLDLYPGALQIHVRDMRERNQRALNDPRLTAFRLVPLIYSCGPDGEDDLEPDEPGFEQTVDPSVQSDFQASLRLDPYAPSPSGRQFGQPIENSKAWRDNLHNQLAD